MMLSCSFIDSIAMDNYDEFGYVNLKNDGNGIWLRDNKYGSDMSNIVSDVSPLQVFFLIFTILACIILAIWSKTLHSSLTKKEPWSPKNESWTPRRQWNMKKAFFGRSKQPEITPVDSGIAASRVRSDATTGTSYYMT